MRKNRPGRLRELVTVQYKKLQLFHQIFSARVKALDLPRNIDSRMYHFQSIRWINEYPIVAGLGNLSLQLGLNQSYFLLVAFLNVFPFFGQGYHVLDSSELSSA